MVRKKCIVKTEKLWEEKLSPWGLLTQMKARVMNLGEIVVEKWQGKN